MKKFLFIALTVILVVAIALIGSACNINKSEIIKIEPVIKDKVAFESSRDGNYEIYIMNISGIYQTNLTNNPAYDAEPWFSPDGSKIAFVSHRDGNYEIYIMNVDGSEQTNFTNSPARESSPCFSPDGTKIAFTSHRDGNPDIYIMNVDGSNLTRLTNNIKSDTNPCFSPDGSKIAFISERDSGEHYFEVYIMNVDGSDQTRLTYDSKVIGSPYFSPDGSRIAFDDTGGIYTIKTNGRGKTMLIGTRSTSDRYFRLSPDWSKIVIIRDGGPYEIGPEENEGILVFTIDAYEKDDGMGEAALTTIIAYGSSPCFSP